MLFRRVLLAASAVLLASAASAWAAGSGTPATVVNTDPPGTVPAYVCETLSTTSMWDPVAGAPGALPDGKCNKWRQVYVPLAQGSASSDPAQQVMMSSADILYFFSWGFGVVLFFWFLGFVVGTIRRVIGMA